MIINNNPMNPVPLWSSISKWQSKRETFHDAMAWPVVLNGKVPAMLLTIGQANAPTESFSVRIAIGQSSTTCTATVSSSGDISIPISTSVSLSLTYVSPMNDHEDYYSVTYTNGLNTIDLCLQGSTSDYVSSADLKEGCVLVDGTDRVTVVLSIYPVVFETTTPMTYKLYKYDDSSTILATQSVTATMVIIRPSMKTSTRYACLRLPETTITGSFNDSVYYITVTDKDDVVLYSEPFLWLTDVSNYTLVEYRRSEPVITTENYLDFGSANLSMYLAGRVMMPPFQFDAEVTEIDGRKYAEKLVSYRKDRIEFLCYEAFAEAVRLLWHCDIRYIGGVRVDYMEPPEVDWGQDNHLCQVVLEFESDTVIQTNGTASAYGDSSDTDHSSYDSSFDGSFD